MRKHTKNDFTFITGTPYKHTHRNGSAVLRVPVLSCHYYDLQLCDESDCWSVDLDWIDQWNKSRAVCIWYLMSIDDEDTDYVLSELEDDIRRAAEHIVEKAVEAEDEYRQSSDYGDDVLSCCLEGYRFTEVQAEAVQYICERWEVSEAEAVTVWEAVDPIYCEARHSCGYWVPSWSDCFRIDCYSDGESEVELCYLLPQASRDEVQDFFGSLYAYGGSDGAWYAVVTDEHLQDLVDEHTTEKNEVTV